MHTNSNSNAGPGDGSSDGLQPERTTLAWRRTGAALAVAALVIGRLTTSDLGPPAIVLTAAAAAVAVGMILATLRRRRLTRPTRGAAVLHDGRAPATLATAIGLLCAVELAAITLGPTALGSP